jgi:hypothetical protein
MVVGGTKPMYNVDIYSGNHPFFQGSKSNVVMDEGMVSNSCTVKSLSLFGTCFQMKVKAVLLVVWMIILNHIYFYILMIAAEQV